MHHLEQRVCILESKARRWMITSVALSLTIVVLVTAGAVLRIPDVVRAQRFEVVDEQGRTVGVFSSRKLGGQLEILSTAGKRTTVVGHRRDGGGLISIGSARGREGIQMGGSDLGGQLQLLYGNGRASIKAGSFKLGTGDLTVHSLDGSAVFEAGSGMDRNGFLTVKSRWGKRLFHAGQPAVGQLSGALVPLARQSGVIQGQ